VRGGFSYELEGEIARGGMGAVVRASDQAIGREVAVKFLLNQSDAGQQARFVEEARITGRLEHPNIVPIHQLGVHADGRCFFSMKMVKGRSLADILKEQARGTSAYTLVRLLNVFTGVCNAVGFAHSRNVIHRDLKPANVMLGDFGEVYVMDWGLAKVLGTCSADAAQELAVSSEAIRGALGKPAGQSAEGGLTQAGAVMGTPAYMPPEQAVGTAVDQRSDVYSLGAILYEVMTLTPPVVGSDPLAILMRVAEGEIEPPAQRAPQRARAGWVPVELSAIALKALARSPADRYQDVEALRSDIELYLEGRSVSAKRDTAWELLKKLVRRNKGVSVATAVALVVLAAVAGVFLKINYDARVAAEAARRQAEEHYNAYLEEQEQRKKQGRDSIPSFLTAARLLIDKRDFEAARAQVRVALDFDPEHAEARGLKGQLALVAADFAGARQELQAYAAKRPDDPLARDLLDFLPRARPSDVNTAVVLAEICTRHRAYALADGALQSLGGNAPAARDKLLALYQQRVESAWPGKGKALTLDRGKGTFHLRLVSFKGLTDLTPLRGIPLRSLDLIQCDGVRDLGPLRSMPLTSLTLAFCRGVTDLEPLRDMQLTELNIRDLTQVTTLEPLRGMPLKSLDISFCYNVTDLDPLRGMPLVELYCDSHGGMKLSSLEPLTGMKLKKLSIHQASRIKDIGPLRDMPLESLNMSFLGNVDDFEPLHGRPLTNLNLAGSRIRDLGVLKGMPLTRLNLWGSPHVKDLTPLVGMPLRELSVGKTPIRDLTPLAAMKLTNLDLFECKKLDKFDVLKGLPLTWLNLNGCEQFRDLELVRGMKLDHLYFSGCKQIGDLAPLAGMELRTVGLTPRFIKKGWEVLRGMKSLDSVGVEVNRSFPAADFWKRLDRGEFK
jgi:serine/threonine protein kinase